MCFTFFINNNHLKKNQNLKRMKKSYLFLLLTVSVLCNCQAVFAQADCNAVGGVAVAPVGCVLTDGSDKANLLVTEYSTAPWVLVIVKNVG